MLFLIAIIIAGLFVWFGSSLLKNHPIPCYIAGAVLTAVAIAVGQAHISGMPPVLSTCLNVFNKGALACALWCAVAWIGALPVGSTPIKRLMPIRGELSIFAALITLSHAVTYGITYVGRLIKFSEAGRTPSVGFLLTCIVSLLLMLIMIPLTIMSFKTIRKKIKPKTWKMLQRAAYAFYALIYVHIMVIYIPRAQKGTSGAMLSILLYSAVFIAYAVFRLRKWYIKAKKPEARAALNAVCAAAFIVMIGVPAIAARPVKADGSQTKTLEESTAETVASTEATSENTSEAAVTESTSESESASEETTETEVTETETETNTDPSASDTTETEAASSEAPVEDPAAAAPAEEAGAAPAPAVEPAPAAEPEIQYVYNNGTFTGSGLSPADDEGKDYESHVEADVTIENDVITAIVLRFPEDDADFFWMANDAIPGRVLAEQSADGVDARCGATRSAEGALEAIRNALNSARR